MSMRKRKFELLLDEDMAEEIKRIAQTERRKVAHVVREALRLYIALRERKLLGAVYTMLDSASAQQSSASVQMPTIVINNIQTLIDKISRIEELIIGGSANIVKIQLSTTDRAQLRDALSVVLPLARNYAIMTPENAATNAVVGYETLRNVKRKIVDVARRLEKRGIRLDDVAAHDKIAQLAVKALAFVDALLDAATADRDARLSHASRAIALARELAQEQAWAN